MSGATYTIRTLEDVAMVPRDRAPVCILEIADTLFRASQAGLIVHEIHWTDDNTPGTTEARLHNPDGSVQVFHPEDFA